MKILIEGFDGTESYSRPPRPIQIKRHKKIGIGFEMQRMSFLTRPLSTMKKAEKLNIPDTELEIKVSSRYPHAKN